MRKIFGIAFLSVFALGFVSCLEDKEPIYSFDREPGIAKFKGDQPFTRTAYGEYYTPEMSSATFETGDYLLASFTVDENNQPTQGVTTGTNFRAVKIGGSSVIIKEGDMTDTYNDSITSMVIYSSMVDNVFFFDFKQKAPSGQEYAYEIICNTDSVIAGSDNNKAPTLYIRSIKTNHPENTDVATITTSYAFDLGDFVSTYKVQYKGESSSYNYISLNIKYKTGTDKAGKDVYKFLSDKPILWRVE